MQLHTNRNLSKVEESGHPLCTVVVLFAPIFHLLLPENNEARETQVLFHLIGLKNTVDEMFYQC